MMMKETEMKLYLITYYVDEASYNVGLARSLDEAEIMATEWLSSLEFEIPGAGCFEAVLIEPGGFYRNDFVSVFRV